MKLNPPRKLRVHELAAELGWTSRQLLAELDDRGEFVKSAASTLEAPVVRAIRRDFAPASTTLPEDDPYALDSYGRSAAATAVDEPGETFEEALRRVKSRSQSSPSGPRQPKWMPPVLAALLEEVVARHGSSPTSRDRKEAHRLHRDWAAACLCGLDDDEAIMVAWIRVSSGRRPMLAAELSRAGIAPEEAALRLGYGGREDVRWPSVYERFRDQKINRSEAIAAIRQWRERHKAG
ncbi:translation initiation factor IF-2 N-terminal domain-containing protein [Mycolicibacterium gilvum]|uniref:Translation initiation factor IF-2, N-terminal region n=1 Tax=Mycolicibacterium gilvum (strain DSM 45189 / LMG 24558 / Spyr1) TaxID=278137 RepID=E6TAV6_MYCSR|nr:Translation initiation factor IF-2, N-terminal region [Mycolicibacterium gilvum Spyr1]